MAADAVAAGALAAGAGAAGWLFACAGGCAGGGTAAEAEAGGATPTAIGGAAGAASGADLDGGAAAARGAGTGRSGLAADGGSALLEAPTAPDGAPEEPAAAWSCCRRSGGEVPCGIAEPGRISGAGASTELGGGSAPAGAADGSEASAGGGGSCCAAGGASGCSAPELATDTDSVPWPGTAGRRSRASRLLQEWRPEIIPTAKEPVAMRATSTAISATRLGRESGRSQCSSFIFQAGGACSSGVSGWDSSPASGVEKESAATSARSSSGSGARSSESSLSKGDAAAGGAATGAAGLPGEGLGRARAAGRAREHGWRRERESKNRARRRPRRFRAWPPIRGCGHGQTQEGRRTICRLPCGFRSSRRCGLRSRSTRRSQEDGTVRERSRGLPWAWQRRRPGRLR